MSKQQHIRKNSSIQAPAAKSAISRTRAPKVQGDGRSYTVSHKEFFDVVQVGPSVSREVAWWTIQPAWDSMFPWLSSIAKNYERYTFKNLKFSYVPRVSTATAGTLVLVCDPDPDDPEISDDDAGRRALLSHSGAVEGPIWSPLECNVSRTILHERTDLFVRQSTIDAIEPRTTDFGRLYVGVYGATPTTQDLRQFGDLWVTFEVTFRVPTLPSLLTTGTSSMMSSVSLDTGLSGLWNNDALAVKPLAKTREIMQTFANVSSLMPGLSTFAQAIEQTHGLFTFSAAPANSLIPGFNTSAPMLFMGRIFVDFYWWGQYTGGVKPNGTTIEANLVRIRDGAVVKQLLSEDLIWTPLLNPADADRARVTYVFSGIMPSLEATSGGDAFGIEVRLTYSSAVVHCAAGPITLLYDGIFVPAVTETAEVSKRRLAALRRTSRAYGNTLTIPRARSLIGTREITPSRTLLSRK